MYALTTHQLQVERRESHRANQVDALTHSYRWRGERDIEPIKWMRSPQPATGGEERGHRANQGMRSHTPATGGEERES